MKKILDVIVMPDTSLQLQWSASEQRIPKSQHIMQEEIFSRFQENSDASLLYLGFCDKSVQLSESLSFWRRCCGLYAEHLRMTPDIESIRHKIEITIGKDAINELLLSAPFMEGSEYLNFEAIELKYKAINSEFKRQVKTYKGTVEEFIHDFSPQTHLLGRVYFHMVENKKGDAPFAFLATYSTSLDKNGRSRHLPLKHALEEFKDSSKKLLDLLTTVRFAAKESEFISELLECGDLFHPLAWSKKEAYTFLKEIPIYENAGILCRIPDWWKGSSSTVRLRLAIGNSQPSSVGLNAIVDLSPELEIDGEHISAEEVKWLLDSAEGLAFLKNKWIAVDHERLKQTLALFEKAQELTASGDFTIKDAMKLQISLSSALNTQRGDDDSIEITNGKWLELVVQKLRNPETIQTYPPSGSFRTSLRPYQQRGVNWLCFLHSLGFGMCLADDMGLGKTIQILAFLNILKTTGKNRAALLLVPASLLSNWQKEIDAFAPNLRYFIAHPDMQTDKNIKPMNSETLDSFDLIITTYGLVQKYEWLKDYQWHYVIVDEAQAIKNPAARQTMAVKKLKAYNRIAMTGTPVENRLSDLWSIFDFINPGLLGSASEFVEFTKGLRQFGGGYSRLRRIASPYILRRLKTDKTVISDLPEKIEMKAYASLSKKQIALYRAMIDDLKNAIENTDGIKRKGIVISFLTKSKQLCNHPDQYLGTGRFEESDSGKFIRLKEICETIRDKHEKALIFTQFKEMTEPLNDFLSGVFGHSGLTLHGSLSVPKRKQIIEEFQDTRHYVPYMILSLKAGGVGLNLTTANHVVHFDRWWNPAVENQATDRAFRIGQRKNVVVHKFIAKGTIEEKIDNMIDAKTALAAEVISEHGETLITEMDNKELIELFTLSL